MATKFTGAYADLYQAGLARLKEREAERKGRALSGAARAGVRTSGVGQIPLARIEREAARGEQQLGADVAGQQESERLRKVRFGEEKELLSLQSDLAAAAERRAGRRARRASSADLWSSLGGAGLSWLLPKK